MRLIHWLTGHLDRKLDGLAVQARQDTARILEAIDTTRGAIMAGVAELEAAINDVKTAVAAETDRVEAVIAALKALPASPDLQAQVDELESIKTALDSVENTPPA